MPSPDLADDWTICQALILDAIDELYAGREEPVDDIYKPWNGMFPEKFKRSN